MGRFADVCVAALVAASVCFMFYRVYGDVDGGGKPLDEWFGYHPTFMMLGMGLMTLGRWAYFLKADINKPQMHKVHRACMTCGVLCVLVGYFSIFMKHKEKDMFFGYDFGKMEWKEGTRVAHAWLGYAFIALCLAQATTGIMKMEMLKLGQRRFTSHATMGKVTMVLGAGAALTATWFTPMWTDDIKAIMASLTVCLTAVAVVPRQAAAVEGVDVAPLM